MISDVGKQAVICLLIIVSYEGLTRATSSEVPDNVVWTSPTATFWLGDTNSTLPCHFREKPIAIYWMKGDSPSSADIVVSWYKGVTSGPGIDDGTHEIDKDHALLFNHPSASDSGRYICRVSNHNAFLIYNHTDLRVLERSENMVNTIPNVSSWKGDTVVLPCDYPKNPSDVIWNKETTDGVASSVTTVMKYSDETYQVYGGERYGWGPTNYALILRRLEVLDEANFTCIIKPFNGGELTNSTYLTVKAHAQEPYVRIDVCEGGSLFETCTYEIPRDQSYFDVVCTVLGAKPPPDVIWIGGPEVSPLNNTKLDVSERDGLFDVTLTLRLHVEDIAKGESVSCLAYGEAVHGNKNQSVVLESMAEVSSVPWGVIVAVVIIVLIIVVLLVMFLMIKLKIWFPPFLRLREEKAQEVDDEMELIDPRLRELRNKIGNYKPGEDLKIEYLSLGLFGVMAAGKSAFINSINFAFSGEYKVSSNEAKPISEGSQTTHREPLKLTNTIRLYDNKGLQDYDLNKIGNLMEQIDGKRGQDPNMKVRHGLYIHCPIFVCDVRPYHTPLDTIIDFLKEFIEEVHKLYGRRFRLVITHKSELGNIDETMIKLCSGTSIEKRNILVIENYTDDSHTEDPDESVKLLEFIWDCLETGEKNVGFKLQAAKEKQKS